MLKAYHDSSFELNNEFPWLVCAVLIGPALMTLGIIPTLLDDWNVDVGVWFMRVGIFLVVFCGFKAGAQENRRAAMYREYLATQDEETLRRAATSPEYDVKTTSVIISFLNTYHPGWSFGHA